MTYVRVNWKDFPDTSTPVDAANLNNMDAGIAAAATTSTTLDQFAAPAANVPFNSKKITGLANGSASSDAAAFGQIPTTLQPTDPGTSKVWGSTGSGASVGVLPPGYEIGYDQITSPVTVSSTTESSGTTVITASAHTFDGSPVIATFYAPGIATAASLGAILVVNLFESTTQIGRLGIVQTSAVGAFETPLVGMIRFTPTAGSHTYTVTSFEASGAGSITAGAGGTTAYAPAFIRFTKV